MGKINDIIKTMPFTPVIVSEGSFVCPAIDKILFPNEICNKKKKIDKILSNIPL